MTDKKDETPKSATPNTQTGAKPVDPKMSDPKRPHATLDLRAIEVKPVKPAEPAKPAERPAAEASKAAPAATTSAGAPGTSTSSASTAAPRPADIKPAETKPTDAKAKPGILPPVRPARSAGIGSTLTHMLAGLIGGGMAWYGATMLAPQYGLNRPAPDPKTATLEQKLASLEKAVSEKTANASGDVAAKLAAAQAQLAKFDVVSKTVADLNAAQAKLSAEAKGLADKLAAEAGSEGPAARMAKLEERLKLMTDAATGDPQAGKLPQIAALSGRLVDMEATLNNQLSALRKTVSQELEQRLSLTNETSEAAKSGTNRIDRDMAAVKSEAAATGQKFDTLRSDTDRLTSAVQAMRDDNNGLKTAIEAIKSDVDAKFKATAKPADVASAVAPVAGKLAALEQNVQSVVKSEDERKTSAERILLSLELTNLKRVIDRGQKYATELADVKKAAGNKVDLSVLDRYKDTGIATLTDLSRDFGPVANAIIDAQADNGDGSVVGRVLASARSVISVRKINYAPDDKTAEAVVGRMDAALKDGNLASVLEEAKKIPAKAANAAQDWLIKVEARGAVDRAIATLESGLKTSLTGAPAAAPAGAAPASK